MYALSIVENDAFREFVDGLNPQYQLPSRKKLTTKILPKMYAEAKNNLKTLLAKAKSISVTIDTWTSVANESFLGITCHFFVDEQEHDERRSPKLFSTTLDVIPILKDEKSQGIGRSYQRHSFGMDHF